MKLFLLSIATVSLLFSAPAFHDKKEFELSNGTTFSGHLKGDEHLNWIASDTGEILLFNKENNRYEYAVIKDNTLLPSGVEKNTHKKTRASELTKERLHKLWKMKRDKEFQRRKSTD
jgi:small nuclear ribonucleoprotein (snRNP)-like protein